MAFRHKNMMPSRLVSCTAFRMDWDTWFLVGHAHLYYTWCHCPKHHIDSNQTIQATSSTKIPWLLPGSTCPLLDAYGGRFGTKRATNLIGGSCSSKSKLESGRFERGWIVVGTEFLVWNPRVVTNYLWSASYLRLCEPGCWKTDSKFQAQMKSSSAGDHAAAAGPVEGKRDSVHSLDCNFWFAIVHVSHQAIIPASIICNLWFSVQTSIVYIFNIFSSYVYLHQQLIIDFPLCVLHSVLCPNSAALLPVPGVIRHQGNGFA